MPSAEPVLPAQQHPPPPGHEQGTTYHGWLETNYLIAIHGFIIQLSKWIFVWFHFGTPQRYRYQIKYSKVLVHIHTLQLQLHFKTQSHMAGPNLEGRVGSTVLLLCSVQSALFNSMDPGNGLVPLPISPTNEIDPAPFHLCTIEKGFSWHSVAEWKS